jgi:ABC-type transport system involved in cytochrome c biogenesis ATPase subunit
MIVIPHKVKRKGKEYYQLIDVKRVRGKTVQKYVVYLGKSIASKSEISIGEILPYVTRLMDLEVPDSEIYEILGKIGIDSDISPITKIVIENDRKLKRTFLRIR